MQTNSKHILHFMFSPIRAARVRILQVPLQFAVWPRAEARGFGELLLWAELPALQFQTSSFQGAL
jgi:hypothetical protein